MPLYNTGPYPAQTFDGVPRCIERVLSKSPTRVFPPKFGDLMSFLFFCFNKKNNLPNLRGLQISLPPFHGQVGSVYYVVACSPTHVFMCV